MLVLEVGGYAGLKPRVAAFLQSVRAAGGRVFEMPRDVNEWGGQIRAKGWEKASAAVTCGMHLPEAAARLVLKRAGIPLVTLDLGYMGNRAEKDRHEGYHQAGIDRIGWLPPFDCPADRWQSLGLPIEERGETRKRGQVVLCLGQVPHDSQHHLPEGSLKSWLKGRAESVRRVTGCPVVYRPHPLAKEHRDLGMGTMAPEGETLEEALDRAAAVVTYNSTAGVEAVRRGIPVVCHPSAHYAEVAWCAGRGVREGYFRRLAYAQWTLDELRDGSALAFLRRFFRP